MGIITISRQLGAGDTVVAQAVAQRLGWECVDKQFFHQQVAAAGVALITGGERERYFMAIRRMVEDYAARGNMVILGRGANFVLKGRDALHFRLIADMPSRITRVMQARWVAEDRAAEIIAESDRDRAEFVQLCFHADVNAAEHYHAVLNTGLLGVDTVVERIVGMALDRWGHEWEPASRMAANG